jgi:hypothetical protein
MRLDRACRGKATPQGSGNQNHHGSERVNGFGQYGGVEVAVVVGDIDEQPLQCPIKTVRRSGPAESTGRNNLVPVGYSHVYQFFLSYVTSKLARLVVAIRAQHTSPTTRT